MSASRPGLGAALALAFAGCAAGTDHVRPTSLPPPARSRAGAPERSAGPVSGSVADAERRSAVATASALVGRRTIVVAGVDYGQDCVSLVRAALDRAGRPLPFAARDAAALLADATRRGDVVRSSRPALGDLVFFADRPDGPPAHVGLVARVDPDGTALVLHRVARGVLRLRVNLAWPDRRTDPATGRQVNDALVVGARALPAGRLVVALSDPFRAR